MLINEVNILVVDDVNAVRFQIKDLLKGMGFRQIQATGSAEEAKVLLDVESFHLVLADWHMTPTDGLDFLKWVRSNPNPKISQVPFILVTGESTKEKVIEAVQAGVDDYIVKPLTIGQVQNRVLGVLTKKKVV